VLPVLPPVVDEAGVDGEAVGVVAGLFLIVGYGLGPLAMNLVPVLTLSITA
jgi:hypothetical protein